MSFREAVWLEILSEWLVNLSAAWVGAVVVIPSIVPLRSPQDGILLMLDLTLGILALYVAKRLRKA
mgnify:CR=1